MAYLSWHPGQRVGQYTLSRVVASGGMAEVWEARLDGPVGFAKRVALKRLMPSMAEEPQFLNLFLDEARLMAALTHPHICQVIELGQHEGTWWVAMEFLAGHTAYQLMRETVKRGWRLPLELAVLIGRDTAEALAYAHAKQDESGQSLGIIHRDVSPQNIMVTYEGVVKLVDFGIAKAATRTVHTETGQLRGKMAYMPPEQARGETVDSRADQFSLGATLFELATHTRLYGNLKEMDLFREVATNAEALPRARSRLPELPEALDDILARMLEREPDKRFPTMTAVRDALTQFLAENSTSLPTTEALARYMTSCFPPEERPALTTLSGGSPASFRSSHDVLATHRRKRWLMGGLVAVLAVGVAGAVLATRPAPPADDPAAMEARPDASVVATAAAPDVPPEDAGAASLAPDVLDDAGVELADEEDTLSPIAPGKRPSPKAVVKKKPGSLSLQTTPWTIVYLGKKNLGETPLVNVPLPPGLHRLRLVNEEKRLSTTIEVEIKSGAVTTKRLKL
ncbi:MAG: serine/threonine protein kinase [Myxococcaceae bacterium]|nr:serine/threonine protein kinase [Myxococcaceae bacterium]